LLLPILAAAALVVPTRERVTPVFGDTWVEWAGRAVTGMASTLLVGLAVARRHRSDRPTG